MKKNIVLFIVVFSICIVFYFSTGIASNEFHFIDDHELYRIKYDLDNLGIIETLKKWISKDIAIRFRPFYYIQRVLSIKILGVNFSYLYFYSFVQFFFTQLFLGLYLKKSNLNIFYIILFYIITFIGLQSEIYWKLGGPAEAIGFLFFSLSLYLTSVKDKTKLNYTLLVVSTVFASLSKESFTISIPCIILSYLYFEIVVYKKSIRKIIIFPVLSSLLFIINLLIILKIGTNNIGYAGVDGSIIDTFIKSKDVIIEKKMYFILVLLPLVSLSFEKLIENRHNLNKIALNNPKLKFLIFNLIFLIFIFVLNAYIYTKSGMNFRYFIPSILGFSFVIVSLLNYSKHISFKILYVFILFFMLSPTYDSMVNEINRYNQEGRDVHSIVSAITNNSHTNTRILIVCDPVQDYETAFSLLKYINLNLKNDHVEYYPIELPNNFEQKFANKLNAEFPGLMENRIMKNHIEKYDLVVFFRENEMKPIFESKIFNLMNYNQILYGIYKLK
jgi:hypothetical protein